MMLIRPVQPSDLDDLFALAMEGGVGVTSLPGNRELLLEKIDRSVRSFDETIEEERGFYFFALEDSATGKVVGVSAVEARVGVDDVWYNYRISTTVTASKELGLHQTIPTLYLTNDMTSCSEVCSLLLSKAYRHSGNGHLLSKCRFLFMADYKEHFSNKVFAEMRGYSDSEGRSPFWEGLGRHFFSMDFYEADYLTGLGKKSFIAEMMPKFPIYIPLLSESAQKVIGKVHDYTEPALKMLESEGFNFNGFIDIFDAGPLVETFLNNIRCVSDSVVRRVVVDSEASSEGENNRPYMVSNRSFANFRVCVIDGAVVHPETVTLTTSAADSLQVKTGDTVRLVELNSKKRRG